MLTSEGVEAIERQFVRVVGIVGSMKASGVVGTRSESPCYRIAEELGVEGWFGIL